MGGPDDKVTSERKEQYRTFVPEDFPDNLEFRLGERTIKFKKRLPLRYGENPGMAAAFFEEIGAAGPNMGHFNIVQQGKGLGYINMGDMDLGQRLTVRLKNTIFQLYESVVIVKHEIPSSVALGGTSLDSFIKAWNSDPLCNFGGVAVFSSRVDEATARYIVDNKIYLEVLYAPEFTGIAREILAAKKDLRLVEMMSLKYPSVDIPLEYKRVAGGLLVQGRFESQIAIPDEDIDVVSKAQPFEHERRAAIFNWNVSCFTRSNSVVIGQEYKTHGVGSGQQSRIDSAYMAIYKANGGNGRTQFYGSKDCVLASDAYMPETDVVELAAKNGITAIIYPLGSIKDKDVIAKADDHNISMIITRKPGATEGGERCFLHR